MRLCVFFLKALRSITSDVHFLGFSIALLLYAVFGSPTPDNPSLLEISIAVLLLLAIGFKAPFRTIINSITMPQEKWRMSALILFLYGLVVPFVMGGLNDASPISIMRDVIGFLFLCLPLFVIDFLSEGKLRRKYFIICILIIGICFSLRTIFSDVIYSGQDIKLLYLANSPLVLFSSIFFLSMAALFLLKKISFKSALKFVCFLGLFALTFLAILVDIQRASVLAVILSAIFLFIFGLVKTPLRMGMPILFVVLLSYFYLPVLSDLIDDVETKTTQVGMNMRYQELLAIWGAMNHSWVSVIFGQGWGASFASPAVGELQVTYTHSLLSYSFFKMGLWGLFLTLIYLFFIFEKLVRLYFSDPVKGNALMWPLLIPVFLYASHKSFDFGLLLTLILLSALKVETKERVTA